MNAIKEFTEAAKTNGEPESLEAYLQNVALLTDQDNEDEEDRDKVTLMTMHSAKGLEFRHVYITGMEDTLFPSPLSAGNPKELEEERRLFYVAVTRAEKLATLTYALNRYKWGNLERSKPSRFISEIDRNFIDYPQTGGKPFPVGIRSGTSSSTFREARKVYVPDSGDHRLKKIGDPVSHFTSNQPGNPDSFSEGDTVHHERFGKGIIISIEGQQPDTTALVEFEDKSRKKLLLRFAKLRKI